MVPKICVYPNIFKYLITMGKKITTAVVKSQQLCEYLSVFGKVLSSKAPKLSLSPWQCSIWPVPKSRWPIPEHLRSRLSWRRVWNFVHGRHNDGAVWPWWSWCGGRRKASPLIWRQLWKFVDSSVKTAFARHFLLHLCIFCFDFFSALLCKRMILKVWDPVVKRKIKKHFNYKSSDKQPEIQDKVWK